MKCSTGTSGAVLRSAQIIPYRFYKQFGHNKVSPKRCFFLIVVVLKGGGRGGVRITDLRKNFAQFTDSRKNSLPFTDSRKNFAQFMDSWRRFLQVDGNGSGRLFRTETLIITRFDRFEQTDWTNIKCEKRKKQVGSNEKRKKENSAKDQNSQIRRHIQKYQTLTPLSHGPTKIRPTQENLRAQKSGNGIPRSDTSATFHLLCEMIR